MISKKVSVLCCLIGLFCCGCSQTAADVSQGLTTAADEPVTATIFAMDTYMTLTAYGKGAQEAIEQGQTCIETLDAMLSTGLDTSEVSRVNQNGSGILSEDAANILTRALEISAETDGAFNPLMYPIMEAWGFPTQNYRVPDEKELDALLERIDTSQVAFDAQSGAVIFLREGMEMDLGGIAKGYTSTKLMDLFASCGVTSGMVSLGGNVQVLGCKPDGTNWRIALQNPDGSDNYLGVLETSDMAVITSGGYERYFEQDGVTYHHIIDPSTGFPADSGLCSVTIVSADGTLADGLSTALFVMGLEKSIAFWQTHSENFDAIFLTDDDQLYVTAGIAEDFVDAYYDVTVIEEG